MCTVNEMKLSPGRPVRPDVCPAGLLVEKEIVFLQLVNVTAKDVSEIEAATRSQASSQAWKDERCKRITASKFGAVCKATERGVKSIVKSLLTWRELRVPAVQHGRKYESVAAEMYENMTGQKTLQCGLFVSQQHPVLAASPDRVVDEDTLLEIKCPFAAKAKQVNPTTVPYLRSENGQLALMKTHDYYYQVQGQLYCTQKRACDFLVYTIADTKIIHINRDESFISEMVDKLMLFYREHFQSALFDKMLYKCYNEM